MFSKKNEFAAQDSSWPGRSAKRVFALDVPAIHVFLVGHDQDVDARHKAGHDEQHWVGEI